jgi:hypothetical protein
MGRAINPQRSLKTFKILYSVIARLGGCVTITKSVISRSLTTRNLTIKQIVKDFSLRSK